MDKEKFRVNLELALNTLIPFSQGFLLDELPLKNRYLVFLNQSYDGNELIGDEQLYPEDSQLKNKSRIVASDAELINLLWRNEKIPEWINLYVHSFDNEFTNIAVVCCGRFTLSDSLLYHTKEGYPPFHVLGPNLPMGWENAEKNGKFKLLWHGRKPNLDEPYY